MSNNNGNNCCGSIRKNGYRGYVQPVVLNKLPLQGPRGVQGDDGGIGLIGTQGAQGRSGRVGKRGDLGPVGPVGDAGVEGFEGEVGDLGEVGFTGGFIGDSKSIGMIFRVSSENGKFPSNIIYPNFQIVESKLATFGAPCGNVVTNVWNNSSNLSNMGLFNSPLGAMQPAGFVVPITRTDYQITYNLSIFLEGFAALIPKVFFFECRNVGTGLAYPGSRSSISVAGQVKHVSHTFLANILTAGTQVAVFVSHEEVGEGGDNICVQILNSNFVIA